MSEQPDPTATPTAGPRRVALLATVPAVLVYVLDQLTKWWVVSTLEPGRRVPVVDGLLWWQFIRNPGAAFSLGEDITWVFSVVMAVVSVMIVLTLRRVRSAPWALALGLVLGGALGNLTDRLLRAPGFGVGHVVDFIAVPRFAIFNIADCGVVVGVGLVVVLTLLGRELDGTRSRPGTAARARAGAGRGGPGQTGGTAGREATGHGTGTPPGEEGTRG